MSYPASVMLLVAGVAVILAMGLPAVMWLLHRIRPQTPEQLHRERLLDEAKREAKRRIGKLPFQGTGSGPSPKRAPRWGRERSGTYFATFAPVATLSTEPSSRLMR